MFLPISHPSRQEKASIHSRKQRHRAVAPAHPWIRLFPCRQRSLPEQQMTMIVTSKITSRLINWTIFTTARMYEFFILSCPSGLVEFAFVLLSRQTSFTFVAIAHAAIAHYSRVTSTLKLCGHFRSKALIATMVVRQQA